MADFIDVDEVVEEPNAIPFFGGYEPPFVGVDTRTFIPNFHEAGLGGSTAGEPVSYIVGIVLDVDGYGCPRTVYALRRDNGTLVGSTESDINGDFTIQIRTLEPCILFALPIDGEQLNAVVLDNILPVPD